MIDIIFTLPLDDGKLARIVIINGKTNLMLNESPTSSEGTAVELTRDEIVELSKALLLAWTHAK